MEKKIETKETVNRVMNDVEMCPAFPEIVPDVNPEEDEDEDDDLEPQEEKYSNFADDEEELVGEMQEWLKTKSYELKCRIEGHLYRNSAEGDGYRFIKLPDLERYFNSGEIDRIHSELLRNPKIGFGPDEHMNPTYRLGKITLDNYLYFDEVQTVGAE